MPLDHDAAELLEAMLRVSEMPTWGADAAAYRDRSKSRAAPRPELPLKRVETFQLDGPAGPLRVRLYADLMDGPLPLLVFFHGGGWVTCDIDTHDDLCRRLSKESGWAVLSVEYRLAPENPYPAALDDAYAAINWATSRAAADLGLDVHRVAVGGDSAGGNLAAAAAIAARDRNGPRLIHQLLIYPVTEPDFETVSYHENSNGYFLTREAMQWFWAQYVGDAATAEPLAAPGRASSFANLPPATIISAGYDPLRDDARTYADRLLAAGVVADYQCYDGAIHGFFSMDTLKSAQSAMSYAAKQLRLAANVV